jgi:hypothetical protein
MNGTQNLSEDIVFLSSKNWTITPYAGVGIDFLSDHHTGYSTISSIKLTYAIYYAIGGLKAHYNWENWMLGFASRLSSYVQSIP